MKTVVISNRLPVKIIEENNELKLIRSEGGLATGLNSIDSGQKMCWVGWAGMYVDDEKQKQKINLQMDDLDFHPVYLSVNQIENYYEGYSNSTIWPLCHYFFSYIESNATYWESYKEVNALFCNVALEIIEPGDTVWVQDYQLMLLPAMLREKIPDINIGYFHHIPFPSYELFRVLPERAEILRGLLGADLIGFHTYDYMRHFISTVYRVLGYECILDEIQLEERMIDIDAFPMGINYELYNNAILNPEVELIAKELRNSISGSKIILSVDRLDYSKGILIRLQAFAEFLEANPKYRGTVSLVMVVVPSRDTVDIYSDLKVRIDEMVGSINGKYSTLSWNPVYYFYRSFSFEELTALYYMADIALVTPIRDGMNLVAKEYLATKRNNTGVLILSEMAGAAIELSDAIIVNPTNTKEINDAIIKALEMPEEEQFSTLKKMQKAIATQTVGQWAQDFISELKNVKERNYSMFEKVIKDESLNNIKDAYDNAQKRLIILDYDGTLSPFYKDPANAYPRPELLQLLEEIIRNKRNRLIINSGRDMDTLDKWFQDLSIGLAAEHGAYYKDKEKWYSNIPEIKWDDEIMHILEQTTRKTPGAKIETKKTAIVWHYRAVDTWLAVLRVNQLIKSLINPCSRLNLQIMRGNKVIEIKTSNFNKGSEAVRLLKMDNYDFVLAIGDDTTDEEMFIALPDDAITIKVGKNATAAKYNLPSQTKTVPFLKNLIKN